MNRTVIYRFLIFPLGLVLVVLGGFFAPAYVFADTLQGATLVRTIDTAAWSPNSPDPAGLAYWAASGHLVIVDSEVEEMPQFFAGKNVFEATTTGNLVNAYTTFTSNPTGTAWNNFSNEPTGVALNPANNHFFFSDDVLKKIWEVNPGADQTFGTADDLVTSISTSAFSDNDPEDLAYGQGKLFVSDGKHGLIYVVDPGSNGLFDGVAPSGDDVVTSFSVGSLGMPDPEGLGFNADTGTLVMVGPGGGNAVLETTTSGALVRKIDISFLNPIWPAGISFAPASDNSGVLDLYISDRVVDNGDNPNENDGKVYEIRIQDSPPTNLLANPSFEFDTNFDSKPDAWTPDNRFTRSNAVVHSGTFAGKHAASDNSGYTIKGTAFNLSAGTNYDISGWVNIPPTSDAFSLKLDVNWQNANGNSIQINTIKTYTAATNGWNQATASLVAPAGTVSAHVRMVVSSLNATIYVDDFSLRQHVGTPTSTFTFTPTFTSTPTNTATNTPTNTLTNTPTDTPTPTSTNTPTSTPTDTPTNTPTPTFTDTPTVVPSDTPTFTPTDTATNTPTDTPTSTVTNTPTTAPPANLLLNPGFELDADHNNKPDNWTNSAKFLRSSEVVHSGSFAGKQFDTTDSDFTINQTVNNLTAGSSYQVSGWVNIPPTSDSFTFKVQVRWLNASG
ncbi:MAG TPA: hypothetical protein VFD70_14110, partial [Anaerolineae bacterium]|nr:hypothetical protein [Anaerolineae bacterium]